MNYEIETRDFIQTISMASEPELRKYDGEEMLVACVKLYNHCGAQVGEICIDVPDEYTTDSTTLREWVFKKLELRVPIESNKTYTYEVITQS